MIGAKLLFFRKIVPTKTRDNRESAVAWCIQDDYFATRRVLITRPMYRLLRRWVEYGEPVCDNASKSFVTPEIHHEDIVFNGADMEELQFVLRKNPLEQTFTAHTKNGTVRTECQWQWQENTNGHWINCSHPLEVDAEHR